MIKLAATEKQVENHLTLITPILLRRIEDVLLAGQILKGNPRQQIVLSTKARNFLSGLNSELALRQFLKESVNQMEIRIGNIIQNWPEVTMPGNPDFEIINNIFLCFGYDRIKKIDFVRQFSLNVCPYCNRNYIFALNRYKHVKPEIDHFFPKSRYPFLGVSFYNLIPSCSVCNGLGGKSKTDPYIVGLKSPYLIDNNDFKFSYEIINWDEKLPLKKSKVAVTMPKKVQVNSDLFKLEGLYEKHSDHVAELIFKSKKEYGPKFREYLSTFDINYSDKELDRMILGNYTEIDEQSMRPLSKLYQDIGEELGLI